MTTANLVVLAAALAVLAYCGLLVFDHEYEDGVIGRIALVTMALAALGRVLGIADALIEGRVDAGITPVALLLWSGLGVFLARHYWRFKRWKRDGRHDWRDPDATVMGGKR